MRSGAAEASLLSLGALRRLMDTGDHPFGLIDARSREEFAAGHIPGAVSLPWEEWCAPGPAERHPITAQDGYWGLLAAEDAAWYGRRLGARGLRHDRPIVVYADGARSMGREGRIAWMLLYLGATTVSLLDGGWRRWHAAGGAVTTDGAHPAPAHFAVTVQSARRARRAELRAAYQAGTPPLLVDTRTPEEFAGRHYSYLPRMGRLPGAILFPFTSLYDPSGAFVARDRYLAALPDALHGAGPVVAYCEVGVRAATFALLHEIHMGRPMAVYDGSLMEWALDHTLPVTVDRGGELR